MKITTDKKVQYLLATISEIFILRGLYLELRVRTQLTTLSEIKLAYLK